MISLKITMKEARTGRCPWCWWWLIAFFPIPLPAHHPKPYLATSHFALISSPLGPRQTARQFPPQESYRNLPPWKLIFLSCLDSFNIPNAIHPHPRSVNSSPTTGLVNSSPALWRVSHLVPPVLGVSSPWDSNRESDSSQISRSPTSLKLVSSLIGKTILGPDSDPDPRSYLNPNRSGQQQVSGGRRWWPIIMCNQFAHRSRSWLQGGRDLVTPKHSGLVHQLGEVLQSGTLEVVQIYTNTRYLLLTATRGQKGTSVKKSALDYFEGCEIIKSFKKVQTTGFRSFPS